jgi:hypothetical protein
VLKAKVQSGAFPGRMISPSYNTTLMVTPAFVLLTQSKSVGATTPLPLVEPTSDSVVDCVAKFAEQAYIVGDVGSGIPVASL